MKLGQPVKIIKRFSKNSKNTDYPNEIPMDAREINTDVYEWTRYSPVDCVITGIITGYKQLATKTKYIVIPDEKVQWQDVHFKHVKEPVYVVQTSLTKKYFVKKEWIEAV